MSEVEFTECQLSDEIKFEWAVRSFGERDDLIIHFFLGQKRAVPEFFSALHAALLAHVPTTHKVETSYTDEFDGHDVVIGGIVAWKAKATVGFIAKHLLSQLSNIEARLAAASVEDSHGQDASEGKGQEASAQGKTNQRKGAPIRLD